MQRRHGSSGEVAGRSFFAPALPPLGAFPPGRAVFVATRSGGHAVVPPRERLLQVQVSFEGGRRPSRVAARVRLLGERCHNLSFINACAPAKIMKMAEKALEAVAALLSKQADSHTHTRLSLLSLPLFLSSLSLSLLCLQSTRQKRKAFGAPALRTVLDSNCQRAGRTFLILYLKRGRCQRQLANRRSGAEQTADWRRGRDLGAQTWVGPSILPIDFRHHGFGVPLSRRRGRNPDNSRERCVSLYIKSVANLIPIKSIQ